jgi:hypothetical protein
VVVEGCGQNGDERRWESSGGRSLYIGMKIHKNSLRMSPYLPSVSTNTLVSS